MSTIVNKHWNRNFNIKTFFETRKAVNASVATVPSYVPAYATWLVECERARFNRIFAPKKFSLSMHGAGSKEDRYENIKANATHRWNRRLSSFFVRYTPTKFAAFRAFFTHTPGEAVTARGASRRSSYVRMPLTRVLYQMFKARSCRLTGSESSVRSVILGALLDTPRRSPSQIVKKYGETFQRNDLRDRLISPKAISGMTAGARGLFPSSGRILRQSMPTVGLYWIMSLHNSGFASPDRRFRRIGGRRIEFASFALSNDLVSGAEFKTKFLQPAMEVEHAALKSRTPAHAMKAISNLRPLLQQRGQNLAVHASMYMPAGRIWRDFRGAIHVTRNETPFIETLGKLRQEYLRKDMHYMVTPRGGHPAPSISAGLGVMHAGRLRPKSIYEYRINKRWQGQRRYLIRMMDWRRVWQYRRYFRHWSARNANGRRFEISRRYTNRLDNFVSSYLGARSVIYARELIKRGHVFVDGQQKFNITMPVQQNEMVSLSKIAHMWLMQPQVNSGAANYMATRFAYNQDVEDKRTVYGRNGRSVVLASSWVHGGTPRNGGRMQFAGSLIDGLTMWRR